MKSYHGKLGNTSRFVSKAACWTNKKKEQEKNCQLLLVLDAMPRWKNWDWLEHVYAGCGHFLIYWFFCPERDQDERVPKPNWANCRGSAAACVWLAAAQTAATRSVQAFRSTPKSEDPRILVSWLDKRTCPVALVRMKTEQRYSKLTVFVLYIMILFSNMKNCQFQLVSQPFLTIFLYFLIAKYRNILNRPLLFFYIVISFSIVSDCFHP
jgi:hypothetical protein